MVAVLSAIYISGISKISLHRSSGEREPNSGIRFSERSRRKQALSLRSRTRVQACKHGTEGVTRPFSVSIEERAMKGSVPPAKRFRASETEQASIRALKNWLLAAPPENALEDQIVRQRLSSAIATLSESQGHATLGPSKKPD
jgi:hypothetical protein